MHTLQSPSRWRRYNNTPGAHARRRTAREAVSKAALALEPMRWDALFLRNPWQRDPVQPCNGFTREQIMEAMLEAEVSDHAFKSLLVAMDELEARNRQTLASRERPNVAIEPRR